MPITVSTLDDFNRANSSTLGANWLPMVYGTGPRIAIVSNSASSPSTILQEFWIPAELGPDVEVQLGLSANLSGGKVVQLFARLVSPFPGDPPGSWPGSWSISQGYWADFQDSGIGVFVVYPDFTSAQIASYPLSLFPAVAAGGAVALRCEGDTISALTRYDGSSSWVTRASVTDTTWPDAGYVGFGLYDGGSTFATGIEAGEEAAPPLATLAAWGILAR